MAGFIVQLDSASFPGKKCFFYRSPRSGGWRNTTSRDDAHVFDTEAEARDAIKTAFSEVLYKAPELNGNLQQRLRAAKIIPA